MYPPRIKSYDLVLQKLGTFWTVFYMKMKDYFHQPYLLIYLSINVQVRVGSVRLGKKQEDQNRGMNWWMLFKEKCRKLWINETWFFVMKIVLYSIQKPNCNAASHWSFILFLSGIHLYMKQLLWINAIMIFFLEQVMLHLLDRMTGSWMCCFGITLGE